MRKADPLAVLLRVRGVELDTAKRDFGACRRASDAIRKAEETLVATHSAESASAEPVAFAAWRPAARIARDQAAALREAADAQEASARTRLAQAHASALLVRQATDQQRALAGRARQQREQRSLDDWKPLKPRWA